MRARGIDLLRAWMAEQPDTRTQAFLARQLRVSAPSVSAWFREVTRPEQAHREVLEVLTGVPAPAWMTDEEQGRLDAARARIANTGTEG